MDTQAAGPSSEPWNPWPYVENTRRQVSSTRCFQYSFSSDTYRPVVWSKTSVIYTSHLSQPLVNATHFPSKRQVTVPQPSVIQTAPYNYGPPNILSISPCDRWLFAYFPGIGAAGVGCLWRRGDEVDVWTEKEWWHFAHGNAPIAAEWIGGNREARNFFLSQAYSLYLTFNSGLQIRLGR
jgi:hypothetical protein